MAAASAEQHRTGRSFHHVPPGAVAGKPLSTRKTGSNGGRRRGGGGGIGGLGLLELGFDD